MKSISILNEVVYIANKLCKSTETSSRLDLDNLNRMFFILPFDFPKASEIFFALNTLRLVQLETGSESTDRQLKYFDVDFSKDGGEDLLIEFGPQVNFERLYFFLYLFKQIYNRENIFIQVREIGYLDDQSPEKNLRTINFVQPRPHQSKGYLSKRPDLVSIKTILDIEVTNYRNAFDSLNLYEPALSEIRERRQREKESIENLKNDQNSINPKFSKYGGVSGLDDDTIDDAFEGDPDNYWNID